MNFQTLNVNREGAVLFVEIDAPPAMKRGFQTRDAEMALARMLGELAGR
jgi:hypothetical protein